MSNIRTTILHNLRLALKNITSLGATLDGPARGKELLHRHDGLNRLGVESRLLLDALVDGNRGVGYHGADHLALDDGLDGFVDVVVVVLADDGFAALVDALGREDFAGGLELGALSLERALNLSLLVVLVLLHSDGDSTVVMLLGKHLLVNNRLDASLVVILVDLLVNSGDNAFAVLLNHPLLGDGGLNNLADFGIRVTVIADEFLDGFLSCLHFD